MSGVKVTKCYTLTGHRDAVYTLQPSGASNLFFSGAGDGMVVLWNLEDPEIGQLIAKLPNSVYALYYDNRSDLLIAGHNYEGIHFLDWRNKKETGSLQLTRAAIFDIRSFENRILVATGEGLVAAVDPERMVVAGRVKESEKSARTIAVNEQTGEIAVGYSDHHIRVFDGELKLKKAWLAHANSVFTLRYTPDGRYLLSGSRDARLKLWDAGAGYILAEEVVAHMYAINHIDFSPDGKHFVTCSMDKSVKVWDAGAMKLLKVIDKSRHAGHGTSVNRLLWTTFDDQLISASDDRTISVWQIIF